MRRGKSKARSSRTRASKASRALRAAAVPLVLACVQRAWGDGVDSFGAPAVEPLHAEPLQLAALPRRPGAARPPSDDAPPATAPSTGAAGAPRAVPRTPGLPPARPARRASVPGPRLASCRSSRRRCGYARPARPRRRRRPGTSGSTPPARWPAATSSPSPTAGASACPTGSATERPRQPLRPVRPERPQGRLPRLRHAGHLLHPHRHQRHACSKPAACPIAQRRQHPPPGQLRASSASGDSQLADREPHRLGRAVQGRRRLPAQGLGPSRPRPSSTSTTSTPTSWASSTPTFASGRDRTDDARRVPGTVRREEAGRPVAQLRLRLRPRRHPGVQQRFPRVPLLRQRAGRPPVRQLRQQPLAVQPRLVQPGRKGHQQRAEHVQLPRPERLHRQRLPPGLPLPRLHGAAQLPRQHRQQRHSVRPATASSSAPQPIGTIARPRTSTPTTSAGRATGTSAGSTSPTSSTRRFGHETFNPIAGQRRRHQRPVLRHRAVLRPGLHPLPGQLRVRQRRPQRPQDGRATGFDSIFDNPNFAGGGFSFFTRQAIPLTGAGVNLSSRNSFLPDLRTSKEQGQANFVNPGLLLFNVGVDFDITPELKLITNASYLQFDNTSSLQLLLQDNKIGRDIGIDFELGVEYRPLLNNNVIVSFGAAAWSPARGSRTCTRRRRSTRRSSGSR